MQTDLGEFENRPVQQAVARFSGRTSQRVGAYADGEEAIVIARVKLSSITHKNFKTSTGPKSPILFSRIQDFTTLRGVLIPLDDGARILDEAIEIADQKFGVTSLFSELTADSAGTEDQDGAQ